MTRHPTASKSLTNTIAKAFNTKAVQIYYFYSDDESVDRSFHYYPAESTVSITLRENQEPLDEFISLYFEVLNSMNEKNYKDLFGKVVAGTISKKDFIQEMGRIQFNACGKLRELLRNLQFKEKETTTSYYYKRFIDYPEKFEDSAQYSKKISSHYEMSIRTLEMQYDALRKEH